MDPVEAKQCLRTMCAAVAFDLDEVAPSVIARMLLLAERTETISDAAEMVARAGRVFAYYEMTRPGAAFSAVERRIVVLGCLFSDVGKTGPVGADEHGQRLIVEMFAVEGVRDETQPLARFLATHFPAESEERIRRIAALGLDPGMSIREFWNQHSAWTLQILGASGLPAEAIPAAAAHHLLDDINPDALVASDQRFRQPYGDNPAFDRAEKLIILLDKYDALLRRGHRTHEQAIQWLQGRVERSTRFHTDAEFLTLLADLAVVLRP